MDCALHRSVLVVEDEPLLAMDIEMILSAAGFRVLGPARTIADALSVLKGDDPDLAILDLNLGVEMAFPVLDFLDRAGKPFVILSGHSRQIVPAQYQTRPFLQKPYESATLLRMIGAALSTARDAPKSVELG